MSNLSDAYREISTIVQQLDEKSRELREIRTRIDILKNDIDRLQDSETDIEQSIYNSKMEASRIANNVGIPFEYSEPVESEWDSSDSWNSSSQYC